MVIRRAERKDIPGLLAHLSQVLEIHASIRPDIFVSGTTKYSEPELEKMIEDDLAPIYVAIEEDVVLAYAFCIIKQPAFQSTMKPMKILYIDDFCVDEDARQKHIGQDLFSYVKEEAKRLGCYEITLSCWEGNGAAKGFYEKMGMRTKSTVLELVID